MGRALDLDEVVQEPTRKVDEVRSLTDQLAAAGADGIGAPFAVIANPSTVTISCAQEHEFAERSFVD